ncbi:MAG: 4-oxalomesaconate tautomerase [Rhodobacteraceae bacterium]|nr:4-oxalomesaconate tautomerase [Paracoccaceae bacterium]
MSQTAIPYHFMRGGTSRGPYMLRSDLPEDLETLSEVLIAVLGSGHALNIDGIGGGATVTTKVAMLSLAQDDWADVDYFFAQVSVEDRLVDIKPTCGNILVGVGPAAIEMGLVESKGDVTEVRINAVNTGARVISKVVTEGGVVQYDGDAKVDGVPGTASPIELSFMDVAGSMTGAMFPTGNRIDVIDGVEVTCIDVAMPMVIARAEDMGLTGAETPAELDDNKALYDRMEPIRLKAAQLMGMGDVTKSVTPKFGVVAPPRDGGSALVRYFMPWRAHPTMAITGSQCLSSCLLCPGTVADGIMARPNTSHVKMQLEHPAGQMEVLMHVEQGDDSFEVISAGVTRTARKLAAGDVFVPAAVWEGHA